MAVNLTNADNALKTLYLDAISHQLDNNVNPFLAAIAKSTNDVWGKEVRKLCTVGLNGGIGAGTEDGSLPLASETNYTQFVSTLKNLYGVIEISDKAIRASENNVGAFVSLLNAEMESLINSSRFNFGRMLFGDGRGLIGKIVSIMSNEFIVESTRNLMEGMVVDVRSQNGQIVDGLTSKKIISIDRGNNAIKLEGVSLEDAMMEDAYFVIQGSYKKEINGLGTLFDIFSDTLYGVPKNNSFMRPYVVEGAGEVSEMLIQRTLDAIEERSGRGINFIMCSWGVRRALQQLFSANKRVIDTVELAGGYKAMSYNGIPIVADRFCPESTMYFLNTEDFTLHQLCDWQWLTDDDGRVLKQVPGKPVYTATLVKYADLICSRPSGQGALLGVIGA